MNNKNKGSFTDDRNRTSQAGQKGGQMPQAGGQRPDNPSGGKSGQQSGSNFAHDRQRASEAGRKGGEHSGGGRS